MIKINHFPQSLFYIVWMSASKYQVQTIQIVISQIRSFIRSKNKSTNLSSRNRSFTIQNMMTFPVVEQYSKFKLTKTQFKIYIAIDWAFIDHYQYFTIYSSNINIMSDNSRIELREEEELRQQSSNFLVYTPEPEHIPSQESLPRSDKIQRKKGSLVPLENRPIPNIPIIVDPYPELSPLKLNTERDTSASPLKKKNSKVSINQQHSSDYQLANYEKSKQFFKNQGYFHKTLQGQILSYQYAGCSISTQNFISQFHSIGVYFYFQLLKRLIILLFFCSIASTLQFYNNYNGVGLASYTKSFAVTLAQLSLGNNSQNTQNQMYLQCCLSTLIALMLIIFYIQWRISSYQTLNQYLRNPEIVQPQRYALTVSGITSTQSLDSLSYRFKRYLQSMGYNVFQCEVILDYDHNFSDYIKLQNLIEAIHQENCLISQGKGSQSALYSKQNQMQTLQRQITQSNAPLKPISIIVHFQTTIDKLKFINYMKYNHRKNSIFQNFARCLCCYNPNQNQLFESSLPLIQNQVIGRPDDIYWQNLDTKFCSKLLRMLFGSLFLGICLIVTSTIIACCILYVSGSASCSNYKPNSLLQSVINDETLLYCFCEENILSSSEQIKSACSSTNSTILVNNALLIVSSVASALTNIILGMAVFYIVKFMKPISQSKQYNVNFIVILIATLINSCFLPLFLNASVFGYTPNTYLQIFKFINFSNIKIVSDFNRDWYAFISPYYTNLFLVAIILPWVNLIKVAIINSIRRCYLKSKIGQILQKKADAIIIGYKFDIATENSLLILNTVICFTYSTSIPLLPLLHLFSLISIYITNRICLLRYSRRIAIDQELNNIIIHMWPFIIILNVCFSIWSLTADYLFSKELFSTVSISFNTDSEFKRAFYFLPLTACLALVIGFLIIDYILIRFLGSCCSSSQAVYPETTNKSTFFSARRHKNSLNSYKMSKNPDYKHAISIVESMLVRRSEQLKRTNGAPQV